MDRKSFIQSLSLFSLIKPSMNLSDLSKIADTLEHSPKMPVLFLGHGSPMNAVEDNEFVQEFKKLGKSLPKPNAIVCISAHWLTRGTHVTAMAQPRTIHDFGGFPKELYEVEYPAPGSPALANEIKQSVKKAEVGLDMKWGLDHGAWTVIMHLFPHADIPVIQLSIDYSKGLQYHYDLAKELTSLRSKGVLIVGSGNMVHNLGMVAWDKLNADFGYDWALEAREKMNHFILQGDHMSLINYQSLGRPFTLSIPTPDHYIPMLYALALKGERDHVSLFNDKPVGGSLTMTSIKINAG